MRKRWFHRWFQRWKRTVFRPSRMRRKIMRSKTKWLVIVMVVCGVVVVGQLLRSVEQWIGPVLLQVAQVRVKVLAREAIHRTIRDERIQRIDWQRSLMSSEATDGSRSSGWVMNYAEQQKVRTIVTEALTQALGTSFRVEQPVSLGQLLHSTLFASVEISVPFHFRGVGIPEVHLDTTTEQAGINNIFFHIRLRVQAEVWIEVPFASASQQVMTEVLLASIWIKGDVPTYYSNNGTMPAVPVLPEGTPKR